MPAERGFKYYMKPGGKGRWRKGGMGCSTGDKGHKGEGATRCNERFDLGLATCDLRLAKEGGPGESRWSSNRGKVDLVGSLD
jgi:hypothetical protein